MEFERITPEQAGISSIHIIDLLNDLKRGGTELHSMILMRRGKVFAECYCKPYNKNSRHTMFSFTKSLTSTAIGFAREEGFLTLDEKLVDIFPEKLPENVSENLKKCTIENLLTMSCGHEDEIPILGMVDKDWIAQFLAHTFKYKPGTHFMYNTAGTNMLCAILKKKSGKELMEYLKPRLFDKIGIGDVPCMKLYDGTDMGGAGSRLTTDEMARFITFVANRGTWNGERLLGEDWFDLATSVRIQTGENCNGGDWENGYGYQFWKCSKDDIFRADGAFGQNGIVCPKLGVVIIITSCSPALQNTLSPLWSDLIPYFEDKPLAEDRENNLILNYVLNHEELAAPISTREPCGEEKFNGTSYKPLHPFNGNWADLTGGAGISAFGDFKLVNKPFSQEEFKSFTFKVSPYEITLEAKVGGETQLLHVSMESAYNTFDMSGKTYGAVGKWVKENIFEFTVRCAESATGRNFRLLFTDNGAILSRSSTYPEAGCLNDYDVSDIVFEKI